MTQYVPGMSLAEVKTSVEAMSIDDRLDVAAFIAHLNRAEDPEYRAELDRRMADMDSGRKTPASELERLHEDLSRKGR
jgi:DNA-binding transcriptional MerR regulator